MRIAKRRRNVMRRSVLGTCYSFGLLTFMKIKSIEDAATPSMSTDLPRVYALHR